MANVIYRGPIHREPQTINLPVGAAILPGAIVVETAGELVAATTANDRLMVLSNRRFYDQGPEDAYDATEKETGVAYRSEPDQEYSCRMAAGTYAKGGELTVGAAGRLRAPTAAASEVVVAFVDGAGGTVADDDRLDVVWANSYTSAA